MCASSSVRLPVLNKFLMLYSLRSGTMLVIVWYFICSTARLLFVIISIPELFLGGKESFSKYLLIAGTNSEDVEKRQCYVYTAFVVLLMAETIVFLHCFYLALGFISDEMNLMRNFLVSRGFTWLAELSTVIILCFIHKILLGWYLIMLIVFILELYSVAIVYSYWSRKKFEIEENERKNLKQTEFI